MSLQRQRFRLWVGFWRWLRFGFRLHFRLVFLRRLRLRLGLCFRLDVLLLPEPRYLSGTSGATLTEEQLNLQVGLKLRDALTELGAEVVMTREVSEISLPNTERCRIANESSSFNAVPVQQRFRHARDNLVLVLPAAEQGVLLRIGHEAHFNKHAGNLGKIERLWLRGRRSAGYRRRSRCRCGNRAGPGHRGRPASAGAGPGGCHRKCGRRCPTPSASWDRPWSWPPANIWTRFWGTASGPSWALTPLLKAARGYRGGRDCSPERPNRSRCSRPGQ